MLNNQNPTPQQTNQELEVKFYIADIPALAHRLEELSAVLSQPRVLEINLRFDTSQGDLTRAIKVLRLRQDTRARLTYKGPGEVRDGVRIRQEIEFTVGDFDAARQFFEALGYQIYMLYEKFRTTYLLEEASITLDEMPYGNFVEVEGPHTELIRDLSLRLGLDWEARSLESYTSLFDRLKTNLGLNFRDLSFANFVGIMVTAANLNLHHAD